MSRSQALLGGALVAPLVLVISAFGAQPLTDGMYALGIGALGLGVARVARSLADASARRRQSRRAELEMEETVRVLALLGKDEPVRVWGANPGELRRLTAEIYTLRQMLARRLSEERRIRDRLPKYAWEFAREDE